jgi:DNA-binding XRE family transcriptional regulator
MPKRPDLEPRPNQYLEDDGSWPEGPLKVPEKPEARFFMELSRNLRDACRGRSKRQVAKDAGISHQTLYDILEGNTWCGVPIVFRLERSLGRSLWPTKHIPPRPPPGRDTPASPS